MGTKKHPNDYSSRPIVRFSRERYPELVAYLESLPAAVLGHDINRRIVESFYGTGPARHAGVDRQDVSATGPRPIESVAMARPMVRFDDGTSKRDTGIHTVTHGTVEQLGRSVEEGEIEAFERLGIKNAADFNDAFDWSKP